MQGTLIRYGPSSAHLAFRSNLNQTHPKHVILIGGLTDGFLFSSYAPLLAERLHQCNWELVQCMMHSSLTGWGTASLDTDADDIHLLAQYLQKHASEGIVIIGHSTGCQDAVRYAQNRYKTVDKTVAPPLLGVVLQAPVSDREFLGSLPNTEERIKLCRAMVAEGKGEEIAFRQFEWDSAPITARRWLSLADVNGDDDMFSSDLTTEQLKERLGQFLSDIPTLLLLSGADECVPSTVDYALLGERMKEAIGSGAQLTIIQGARHDVKGFEEEAVAAMIHFIQGL